MNIQEYASHIPSPLRIAILECDTPLEGTRAKYGGYGGLFKVLLQAGADALGQPEVISSRKGMEVTMWDVVTAQTYPDLADIDAILLTGSSMQIHFCSGWHLNKNLELTLVTGHNSFDDNPWTVKLVDFVTRVLAQDRVRIIGVCFGHQIVGRAMGAKVGRSDIGWETSVLPVELSAKGKELFKQPGLSLQQMHRDIVYDFPEGVEELGSSPRCRNQGMYISKRFITVQGHPEFNAEIMAELLAARHDQGIFDDVVYNDSMARAGNHHDGVAVAQGFLRFLMEQ
ncbi:MAG: hypothetical protein M1836_007670 [Candelina mexicana]|nr:MAG: hypothetical protein M1836_007670 [Candelina mexicana]